MKLKTKFVTIAMLLLIVVLSVPDVVNVLSSPEQRGPVIDKLRFKVVKSPDAQLIEMLTGGTDIWTTLVSPENERGVTIAADDILREGDIETLDANGFTVTSASGYDVAYFGFNIRPNQSYRYRPDGYQVGLVLSDVNFRHACVHVFDQERLSAGRWTITQVESLIPSAQCDWMNPNVPTHPYNPGDPMATAEYPADHSSCGILRFGGYLYNPVISNWVTPYDLDDDGTPGTNHPDRPLIVLDLDDVIPKLKAATPTFTVAPLSVEVASMWVTDLRKIGLNSVTHSPGPLNRGLMEEWRYPMFYYEWGWFGSSPAIADLGPDVNNNGTDPDSDLEIVTGSDEFYNSYWELGGWASGIWRCLDSGGNLEWATRSESDETRGSVAIVDINGDGYLDIAGGTTSGETVEVMDRFGNFMWTFPEPPRAGNFYYPGAPAVADLDPAIGGLEVVIGNRPFGTVLAFDGDNSDGVDEGISAAGIPGSPYAGVEGVDWDLLWIFYTGNSVWSSPAVGDVDNDGTLEVVIGSTDGNVYVLDGPTGSLEHAFSTAGAVYASAALANLDGDAYLEIVIGSTDDNVYCFQWNGTASTEWTYPTGGDVYSSAAIGDVDGDGSYEIVVGSNDGNVYCISASGTMEWSYPTGGAVFSSPALANTDEVVKHAKDWPMFRNNPSRTGLYGIAPPTHLDVYVGSDSGYLCLLDGEYGSPIDLFQVYTGPNGGIHTSPSVADIDGDNRLEILFYDWGASSTRNGHTFWCLEDTPFGNIYDVFKNADFDMYFVCSNVDRFPDFLYELCHSSQDCRVYPWRHNAPGLSDPELDSLVETLMWSLDHDVKVVACQEVQERLYNESCDYAFAYLPVYSKVCFGAYQPGLLGILNTVGYGPDNMWTYLSMNWELGHPNERIEAGETVVVWCLQDEPQRLSPTYSGTIYSWAIMNPIFDPLIAVNPYTHEDLPWLAESWEISAPFSGTVTLDSDNRYLGVLAGGTVAVTDGMNVTFNLRSDVEWQCGNLYNPFDAEFNLEFLRNNEIPRYASMWEHVVDVQVINATAFKVVSDTTSQWLLYDFAETAALLPPPVWSWLDGQPLWAILGCDPSANITMPTGAGPRFGTGDCPTQLYGTGPFVFVYYDPIAQYTDMPANRYYFKETAEIHDELVEMFHKCGDVDRDGDVWGVDMVRYSLSYGYGEGEPEYDVDADLNEDGIVDVEEGDLIGLYFGSKQMYPNLGAGVSPSFNHIEQQYFSPNPLGAEMHASSSAETTIFVDPIQIVNESLQAGASFSVNTSISDVSNLRTWQVMMSWNASVLNVTQITEGDFLKGNPTLEWNGKPAEHETEPYWEQTKTPTSSNTIVAGWIPYPLFPPKTLVECVSASDGKYIESSTTNAQEEWGDFGFNAASMSCVARLEVGVQAYMDHESNTTELEKLEVQVSNDGGTTWGLNHEVPIYIYEQLWWVDVTEDFSWIPDMLTDTNFKVRVRYKQAGETATTIYLNWILGKALDTLYVDNPAGAYDTNLDSYASFRYGETDGNFTMFDFGHNLPGGSMWPTEEMSEIAQVDLYLRYSANASSAGDKYRIVYYTPWTADPVVLVDWTSSATPLQTYVWTNISDPDIFFPEWDWVEISNLEIAVETDRVGGDPYAFFREHEAWIVVTYKRSTHLLYRINQDEGWCLFSGMTQGRSPGVTGSGWLATLEFQVLEYGHSILNVTRAPTKLLRLRCHPLIPEIIPHLTENGYFRNTIPGDIQADTTDTQPDGDVDMFDFFAFADHYATFEGDPNYNILADLQGDTAGTLPDGDVDMFDFFAFADNYGRSI